MKKNNQKGFALAETLIVTVFLMVLFGLIYTSFFPLIGEYEKRETFDDIDGKYSIFWIKRMIETAEYNLKKDVIERYGYIRFQCKDLSSGDSITMCKDIVKALQINNCDKEGNNCDIFISNFRLQNKESIQVHLKDKVETNLKRENECNTLDCSSQSSYVNICMQNNTRTECEKQGKRPVFSDGFKSYMFFLPNYSKKSSTGAAYRVTTIIHNTKDANDYYSYATIEVNR